MQIYAKRFYSFTINPIVLTCQGKISSVEGNGGIKNCLGNECFLVLGLDSGCRLRKANVQDRINFNLPARSIVFIPQRSERKGISMMVSLPSECRESKV
jgi:hypothetical protein